MFFICYEEWGFISDYLHPNLIDIMVNVMLSSEPFYWFYYKHMVFVNIFVKIVIWVKLLINSKKNRI